MWENLGEFVVTLLSLLKQPPSDLGVDIHTRRSQLQPPKRVGIIGNLYSLVQYKRHLTGVEGISKSLAVSRD